MSAPLKAVDGNADLPELMTDLAARARQAARVLALAPPEQKNRALEAIERAIRANARLHRPADAHPSACRCDGRWGCDRARDQGSGRGGDRALEASQWHDD